MRARTGQTVGWCADPARRALGHVVAAAAWFVFAVVAALAPGGALAAEPTPAPPAASAPAPAPVTAVPAARQASKVVVVPIDGPIDHVTTYSVKRRLRAAERAGADAVVFEINSPGGEVGAVLEICDAIKNAPIPNTVAWINTTAYSGGAIIALACRETVVADYATMGDAAPIRIGPMGVEEMSPTERQKFLSPLLAEIVDSARRRGYDEMMVQGLVSLGVELWLIEDTQTGERWFITEDEHRALFEGDPPRGAPRVASGGVRAGERVEGALPPRFIEPHGAQRTQDPAGFVPATPALGGRVAEDVDLALSTPSRRPVFSEADRGRYRLVEYFSDGRSLLILKSDEMLRYGVASAVVRGEGDLKTFFGAQSVRRLETSWSEWLVRALSNMAVRGVLIVLFLIAMFIELISPGVGLAGAVAGLCLLGLLAPPLLIGAAAWWTVAAVFAGIGLILVELFVIPGTTVAGLGGAALLVAGLVGTFVGADPSRMGDEIVHGLAITLLAVFVAGVAMYFVGKAYGSFPVLNRLILTGADRGEDDGAGMLAAMAPEDPSAPVKRGEVGRAVTSLRPAGSAYFGDRLVDVVSEVGFIEAGTPLRVVSVSAYRVAVEPVDGDAGPTPGASA